MKELIFSDLHLHNWSYGAYYNKGWNKRLMIQRDFLKNLTRVIREEGIQRISCCGDIFHQHGNVTADVLSVAYECFSNLSDLVEEAVLIPGNHDFQTKDGKINLTSFLEGAGWNVAFPMLKDGNHGYIAFTHNKKEFTDRLKQLKRCEFLFLHQGVQNVPVGNGFELPNEFLHSNLIPTKSLAFTGHYHKHQKVSDNLVIVGSPMQHTWSDSGDERGYIILDTKTKSWEHRVWEGPRFIKQEVKVGQPINYFDFTGNYIRIYGDVPLSELEDAKETAYDHGAASVEIVPKVKIQPTQFNINVKSLEEAILEFEEDLQLDERFSTLGRELRTGTYGTNKLKH